MRLRKGFHSLPVELGLVSQGGERFELHLHARRPRDAAHYRNLWFQIQVERGYDVITIYEEAARADPEMARVWVSVLRQRDEAITRFIGSLAASLKRGIDVKTAVDLVWALERPEVFRELVIVRGWSLDRYETWLAETLKEQLLGEPPKQSRRLVKRS